MSKILTGIPTKLLSVLNKLNLNTPGTTKLPRIFYHKLLKKR